MSRSGATSVGWARWMNTATSPEPGAPSSPPCRTSHVPAGVFTAELGSVTAGPAAPAAASAVLVALATAWIEADRTPCVDRATESSASSGSADDDARISPPEASSSTTPGASGSDSGGFARLGDQPAADGAREQGRRVGEQVDLAGWRTRAGRLGGRGSAPPRSCRRRRTRSEARGRVQPASAGHESVGFAPDAHRSLRSSSPPCARRARAGRTCSRRRPRTRCGPGRGSGRAGPGGDAG